MSEELGLEKVLRLVQVESGKEYRIVEEGLSVDDQWFRMSKIYAQEEKREKEGWRRSIGSVA